MRRIRPNLDMSRLMATLALSLITAIYGYRIVIANPGYPDIWLKLTVMFAGPYMFFALMSIVSRRTPLVVMAWTLVVLNGLAYVLGGFSDSRETGVVMVPVIFIAWVLCILGFGYFLAALLQGTPASPSTHSCSNADSANPRSKED